MMLVPQRLRRTSLLALVLAALAGGACATTEPQVNLTFVLADTGRVFALSGTDPIFPTAINIPSRVVVIATVLSDGTVPFDVAFDLTPAGKVLVLPARSVVLGPNVVPPSIGLFLPGGTFDAATEAPSVGFVLDSVKTVSPGEPFVLQLRPLECSFSILQTMHAKMVVDSVNLTSRLLYYRLVLNPNCGRRGLVPGGF